MYSNTMFTQHAAYGDPK